MNYDARPSILVVADDRSAAADAAAAVESAGGRLIGPVSLDAAADHRIADLVLLELAGVDDALASAVLDAMCRNIGAEQPLMIVAFGPSQIDLVAAALLGTPAELLCAPDVTARVGALALRLADRGRAWAADVTRDTEGERLRRLNEEVARIAETLAQLTRTDPPMREGVRAKTPGYRGHEVDDDAEPVPAAEVRAAIRGRRMRAQFFDEALFADPAWDMLLDLYAAHLERLQVSVSSLCIAAAVPPTTALRWIATLHEAGLFERRADPADRRRAYIALSDIGLGAMHRFITTIRRAGMHIP